MATAIFWIAIVLASIAGLVVLGWALHRLCLYLEERGYPYYRKGPEDPSGGVPGALMELDRVVRPSVQHVIEVEHAAKIQNEDDTGGE